MSCRRSTGGDDEPARSPPGQGECIPGEPTEPRLDDEAEPVRVSTDVSTSSEQPSASRDGKHRTSGFNPKWLADPKFSGWLYKTEYVSDRRIVILGKTGSGKSSLANTIFGEKLLKIGHTAKSETKICRAETKSVNGRNITLIDTPGFFDTDRSEEEMKREIVRCITECAPGPHAFLIVLKVERFTEQEQAVINKIKEYFSEEAFKYATVLFTHGDDLDEGQTINDFVSNNELADDLVKKCGGRCHVIDNKYWNKSSKDEYRSNQFQVEELLKSIDKMVEINKGSCYTNEMLQAVEKKIQQQKQHIRQSSPDMSEKEASEQARDNVHSELVTKLDGTTTDDWLGAFFGSVTPLKVLIAVGVLGGATLAGAVVAGATVIGVALAGAAVAGFVVAPKVAAPKTAEESKKKK